MGSIRLSAELNGVGKLQTYFDHLEHVPDDWRGAWEPMADDFWQAERDTFAGEGPGWAPLRPRYKAWKEKHYPGMPILVQTGALELSLSGPHEKGAIYDVFPTEMSLGTNLKTKDERYTLGMLHQTGTRRGMPARPPVIIRKSLQEQWNRRLVRWLQDELDYKG